MLGCECEYEGDCKCGVCECNGEYEVECEGVKRVRECKWRVSVMCQGV